MSSRYYTYPVFFKYFLVLALGLFLLARFNALNKLGKQIVPKSLMAFSLF